MAQRLVGKNRLTIDERDFQESLPKKRKAPHNFRFVYFTDFLEEIQCFDRYKLS